MKADGRQWMDSAILIRTADIADIAETPQASKASQLRIGVGATLVRHSNASSEVAETHAKAAGVLKALSGSGVRSGSVAYRAPRMAHHPSVETALRRRNETIARFWLEDAQSRLAPHPQLQGRRAVIVDAEDTFTAMLANQLSAIGLDVDVVRFDKHIRMNDYDLAVMGPGPGDPRDKNHPRMSRMFSVIDGLLAHRKPFFAVCLSHQLLCRRLGLELRRRDVPNQGTQSEIDLFATPRRVGFYNSFAAFVGADRFVSPDVGHVLVSRNPVSGEVHALKGPHFASVQFHVESVLTQDAQAIYAELLSPLMTSKELLYA